MYKDMSLTVGQNAARSLCAASGRCPVIREFRIRILGAVQGAQTDLQ